MATPYVPFNPGTVAVTNGSKAIVGTGTNFTVYEPFDFLMIDGIGPVMLETITDATHATAVFNATVTGAGKAYRWVPMADVTKALTLYQGLSAAMTSGNVSALAQLVGAADKLLFFTGAGTMDLAALTAFARTLLDDPDAATMLTTLGLSANGKSLVTAVNYAAMRTALGLGIGSDVQAYNARLAALAGLIGADGSFVRWTGSATAVMQAIVGTVSQSGGVPTGAVIEQGTNANGTYVKFADGTLMCWSTISVLYNNSAYLQQLWTFPAAFVISGGDGARVFLTLPHQNTAYTDVVQGNIAIVGQLTATVSTGAAVVVWKQTGAPNFVSTSKIDTVRVFAVGRWF